MRNKKRGKSREAEEQKSKEARKSRKQRSKEAGKAEKTGKIREKHKSGEAEKQ
jgi:hypothetical protein